MSRLLLVLLATTALIPAARAADPAPIRITVLADLDDDVYDARSGRGGVDATRMAVADFGGSVLGRPVVVDSLNDHNKPAEAPSLASQAFDAGADLLMDVQNSPIALAVSKIATERKRIAISTGSAIPALTRGACSRYVYHYSFDGPSIETTTANYLAAQPKNKRWVMVAGDAGFGRGAIATFTPPITAHGGEVVKSFIVPPATTDYSAVLEEVRGLHPDVVGMFGDAVRGDAAVTAATKAGLDAQITAGLLYISDVERVKGGYAGVVAAVPWYWALDAASRAWADRFAAAHNGQRPTEAQAADYSATTQWLTAVRTAGTTDADAVVHALDGHKFSDMFARDAEFRAGDHAVVHDLYIVKVKSPAEVTEPHAWFDVLATVPAATAFPTNTDCKMP